MIQTGTLPDRMSLKALLNKLSSREFVGNEAFLLSNDGFYWTTTQQI